MEYLTDPFLTAPFLIDPGRIDGLALVTGAAGLQR